MRIHNLDNHSETNYKTVEYGNQKTLLKIILDVSLKSKSDALQYTK
jgi:hypothetical protein